MSNLAIQIWPEAMRSINSGDLTGTYMGIGSATLNATRVYWIQNNTDVLLTFSWDGVNDHFVLPDDSFFLLDCSSNKSNVGGVLSVPAGTRTYVKAINGAPTKGSVNLAIFYGKNG